MIACVGIKTGIADGAHFTHFIDNGTYIVLQLKIAQGQFGLNGFQSGLQQSQVVFKKRVGYNTTQQIIAPFQIRFRLTDKILLYQVHLAGQNSGKTQRNNHCQRQKQFKLN
jgi:hypothetical protein